MLQIAGLIQSEGTKNVSNVEHTFRPSQFSLQDLPSLPPIAFSRKYTVIGHQVPFFTKAIEAATKVVDTVLPSDSAGSASDAYAANRIDHSLANYISMVSAAGVALSLPLHYKSASQSNIAIASVTFLAFELFIEMLFVGLECVFLKDIPVGKLRWFGGHIFLGSVFGGVAGLMGVYLGLNSMYGIG
ncbi:hypothetical protein BC829DRAFT_90096 [Chytridium lagenaria]|nr:hypothetical protein BC829DRAFT_90096 [Chytridium lagenaria]